MKKSDLRFILFSFLSWRILLFIFLAIAISFLSLQKNFLGGGLTSYSRNPCLWAWANFDGEHFLSIAYRGYQPLTYFFFPVYPMVTRFIASIFADNFTSIAVSGLLVSNIAFFIALVGFWKLIRLDYKKNVVVFALLLLLSFPASFYFGSLYSEAVFLSLATWSFYCSRKKKWIFAGLLGAVATATRLVGIALLPALIVEAWLQHKKDRKLGLFKPALGIILVPVGILAYSYFLKVKTGDPLEFFHSVAIFGEQRSTALILLPQVFYRYFFKILPSLNYSYFPVVFSTFFELIVAIVLSALSVLAFFRVRLSYAVYLVLGFLIPTLSGSFSSLPRYALVLFPAFILEAVYFSNFKKANRIIFIIARTILLGIATSLFIRGYWVA